MIAKKTHVSLASRAKLGQATGSCPYGYQPGERADGTKTLQVVASEAGVVRRIFQMFADGMGGKQIAYALNDDGVPSPGKSWKRAARRTDGKWHPSAIVGDPVKAVGFWNNETYTGKLIWNRSKWTNPDSGKRTRTTLPREQWVVTSAPDLRIVDDVLWRKVQARFASTQERTRVARERAAALIEQGLPSHRTRGAYQNAAHARPGHSSYVLSGLLKCGYAAATTRWLTASTRAPPAPICGLSGCTNY